MFNLRFTDCDQEDDLLNEFLDCEDLGEAGIENASNELPNQSDQLADAVTLSFGGVDNVPSNQIGDVLSVLPEDQMTSRGSAEQATNHNTASSGKADELQRLFEDDDNQYSSSLINDQLILNSKVSGGSR